VVFPLTPHKFFLDAAPEVRARRRAEQLRAAGQAVDEAALTEEIRARDERDSSREDSPLRADPSYVVVDTSALGVEEVIELMARRVRELRPAAR
jgi:CMP/dCMP kinase